jgi:cholesterol oxidase
VRYLELAEAMLKPSRYPEKRARLPKFDALDRAARALNLPFDRVPILVNFDDLPNGLNALGVPQSPCVDCGDCVSGCNYGAKNTLLMNYLPDARQYGAELFTGARVSRVVPEGGGWRVPFHTDSERNGRFPDGVGAVSAGSVVLAAGTLGSTEILLRSRAAGLNTSSAVGQHFSGNGDMIGLVYNADSVMNSVGFGHHVPAGRMPVGPTSTGIIDARAGRGVRDGMILVDGTIPGAFGHWLPAIDSALATLIGENTDHGRADKIAERARALQSKVMGPYTGSVHNTLLCLVVAQDEAAGQIVLNGDRLTIRWPGAGDEARLARASESIRSIAAVLGGTFIPNPSWHPWLGHRPLTGHPLGGCAMADDSRDGVVNDRGQVFSGESGAAVHPGLYVMDGAVIPRSLGVNPLLTIAAVAERCCDQWVRAMDGLKASR